MKSRKSVQIVENAQLKENLPEFNQGDTVLVQVIVKEGSRERTQPFESLKDINSMISALVTSFNTIFDLSKYFKKRFRSLE